MNWIHDTWWSFGYCYPTTPPLSFECIRIGVGPIALAALILVALTGLMIVNRSS